MKKTDFSLSSGFSYVAPNNFALDLARLDPKRLGLRCPILSFALPLLCQ